MADETESFVDERSNLGMTAGLGQRRSDDKKQDQKCQRRGHAPNVNSGTGGLPAERAAIKNHFIHSLAAKPLEANHRIRPALDVNAVNEANVFRFAGHHHRVRAFTGAEETYAPHKRSVSDAGRGEDDFLSRS